MAKRACWAALFAGMIISHCRKVRWLTGLPEKENFSRGGMFRLHASRFTARSSGSLSEALE